MGIYIILAVIYAVCAYLIPSSKMSKGTRKGYLFFLLLPLFVLTAFRSIEVGNDTYNYFRAYNIVASKASLLDAIRNSRLEVGYVTLEFILSRFGMSYYGFQIMATIIIYIGVFFFISKYSGDYALSCYVFLTLRMFSGPMNTVRMWLAISVLVYAIRYIQERKILKFLSLVVLASTFQYSSFIFLLAYILPNIKKRKYVYPVVLSSALIIRMAGTGFFSWLTNVIGRYQGYLDSVYFNTEGNTAVYYSLAISFVFLLYFRNLKLFSKDQNAFDSSANPYIDIWMNFYLLIVAIDIAGLRTAIMSRVTSYFNISSLAIIPYSINAITYKGNREILKLLIIIALFLQFLIILIYRPQWNYIANYSFFWAK